MSLSGSGTRFYSDSEIELLIEDLTEAALEAIELAAAEAARAAYLDGVEREAELLREAARGQAEAARLRNETEQIRRTGIKNAVIAGIICFAGGLVTGLLISK
jgi:hypothetical protein